MSATYQGSIKKSATALEKSLLDAMDAALDGSDWCTFDELLEKLTRLTRCVRQSAQVRCVH